MQSKHRRIIREQLDSTFGGISRVHLQPPARGWLRSIRDALGMSGKQLGERMGVSQPRIVQLEKDEISGALTLKTMRQAAEAMDCIFVYAVVPRASLEETVRNQARKVAEKRLARTSHTMMLENQQLADDEQKRMLEVKVDDLVREMPKDLWDNK